MEHSSKASERRRYRRQSHAGRKENEKRDCQGEKGRENLLKKEEEEEKKNKHFCWVEEKQPWKLNQTKTKTRGRTKEVPMSTYKEPVQFFSLLCLLGL